MEDFEKGLMLLGLVSPLTLQEKEEMEEVETHKKSPLRDSSKSKIYFKRVVLAAEIVTQLREEKTFGRIKFQKLMYVCEHVAQMKLAERYLKQAAGPFDNKFMHTIDSEFKKQKWFNVVKVTDGKFTVPRYFPLEKSEEYKKYYANYFSEYDEHIQFVIGLFRYKRTDETELAATILACVLELTQDTNTIKWLDLFNVFYNWHDKKKRFTHTQIINSFNWLNENSLLPVIIIN
jgi:hypothetical protein